MKVWPVRAFNTRATQGAWSSAIDGMRSLPSLTLPTRRGAGYIKESLLVGKGYQNVVPWWRAQIASQSS